MRLKKGDAIGSGFKGNPEPVAGFSTREGEWLCRESFVDASGDGSDNLQEPSPLESSTIKAVVTLECVFFMSPRLFR